MLSSATAAASTTSTGSQPAAAPLPCQAHQPPRRPAAAAPAQQETPRGSSEGRDRSFRSPKAPAAPPTAQQQHLHAREARLRHDLRQHQRRAQRPAPQRPQLQQPQRHRAGLQQQERCAVRQLAAGRQPPQGLPRQQGQAAGARRQQQHPQARHARVRPETGRAQPGKARGASLASQPRRLWAALPRQLAQPLLPLLLLLLLLPLLVVLPPLLLPAPSAQRRPPRQVPVARWALRSHLQLPARCRPSSCCHCSTSWLPRPRQRGLGGCSISSWAAPLLLPLWGRRQARRQLARSQAAAAAGLGPPPRHPQGLVLLPAGQRRHPPRNVLQEARRSGVLVLPRQRGRRQALQSARRGGAGQGVCVRGWGLAPGPAPRMGAVGGRQALGGAGGSGGGGGGWCR
jgi:hypothetical protein